MNDALSITLWNVEWATPNSVRGIFFKRRLAELSSHVICLTEGYRELLPVSGHVIESEPDYGYPSHPGRRKVLLWSPKPWRNVDTVGASTLPTGRFVSGATDTPVGEVRVIGICIPWHDAHVRTGRRDRQPWQDHLTYLQNLRSVLSQYDMTIPTVLLGDFNQRVPRSRQPELVFRALTDALSCDFTLITKGLISDSAERTIDHLAVNSALLSRGIESLSRFSEGGVAMSDHFGLRIFLQPAETANEMRP